MLKTVGRHVPPPAGVLSPLAWGTENWLHELLGAGADLAITRRQFTFRYRSASAWFETSLTLGPDHDHTDGTAGLSSR